MPDEEKATALHSLENGSSWRGGYELGQAPGSCLSKHRAQTAEVSYLARPQIDIPAIDSALPTLQAADMPARVDASGAGGMLDDRSSLDTGR